MKKYVTVGLFSLSIFTLVGCNEAPIEEAKKGNMLLDIIEINDLHGYTNLAAKTEGYNLSNISYYVEQKRMQEDTEVLLIANGDMFEGTAFSNLSLGLSTLNVMNTMDFDMMGIGNHEFSWGLDSVLDFFDQNLENGESNFPLINGNVYTDSKLYGEEDLTDNILPYTIVEKGDIKVGLLSYIGDIASSIASSKLEKFEIKADLDFFKEKVYEDSIKLKEEGADFIVFNVHGGNSNSIEEYDINQVVQELKDNDGNYLIDAIINGHTHNRQSSNKKRGNGKIPMVQGGSYCDSFGEIVLEINLDEMKIEDTSSSVINVSTIKRDNIDYKVQVEIDKEYAKIKDTVEKTYCTNPNWVSKEALGSLMAKELRIATSADLSIMNTGGIRQALDKGDISFASVYDIYPFENHILCLKIKGYYINQWIKEEADYYYMDYDIEFDRDTVYNVTTIDYVYESSYFKDIIKRYELVSESNKITPRDYLINDLENRGNTPFDISAEVMVDIKPFGEFE